MNLKDFIDRMNDDNEKKRKQQLAPYLKQYPDNALQIDPQPLYGNWTQGFALDLHTISSHPLKDSEGNNITDDHGKIKWDTKYTMIGEEMNKLKYWKEQFRVTKIATVASSFIKCYTGEWQVSYIIPIPPSDTTRYFQPVYKLAEATGNLCNLPVNYNLLKKVKSTSQLKEIEDPEQRKAILDGAFDTTQNSLTGRNILLFDDLYRSGETLKAAAQILKNKAGVKNVYILTITKTRSKR
jgi:competence protein ComFC